MFLAKQTRRPRSSPAGPEDRLRVLWIGCVGAAGLDAPDRPVPLHRQGRSPGGCRARGSLTDEQVRRLRASRVRRRARPPGRACSRIRHGSGMRVRTDHARPELRRLSARAAASKREGDENFFVHRRRDPPRGHRRRAPVTREHTTLLASYRVRQPRPGRSRSGWTYRMAATPACTPCRFTGSSDARCSTRCGRPERQGRRQAATRWCASGIAPRRPGCRARRTTTFCTSRTRWGCSRTIRTCSFSPDACARRSRAPACRAW